MRLLLKPFISGHVTLVVGIMSSYPEKASKTNSQDMSHAANAVLRFLLNRPVNLRIPALYVGNIALSVTIVYALRPMK